MNGMRQKRSLIVIALAVGALMVYLIPSSALLASSQANASSGGNSGDPTQSQSVSFQSRHATITCADGTISTHTKVSFAANEKIVTDKYYYIIKDKISGHVDAHTKDFGDVNTRLHYSINQASITHTGFTLQGSHGVDKLCPGEVGQTFSNFPVTITGQCGKNSQVTISVADGNKITATGLAICKFKSS